MYKHQSLHLQPATTTTILSLPPPPPPPQQSITVLSGLIVVLPRGFHVGRIYDLYLKIDNYVNETVKEVVHNALQAPICDRFRELSEFEMKEILHDWMFESGSYRSHLEHATLYEALEASMDRENGEEFIEARPKSRHPKRRHDDQDPPPTPPKDSDQSKKKRHESDAHASNLASSFTSSAWMTFDT
ncbi:E-beta-farnesene synthase [Tanacetum coccineum]